MLHDPALNTSNWKSRCIATVLSACFFHFPVVVCIHSMILPNQSICWTLSTPFTLLCHLSIRCIDIYPQITLRIELSKAQPLNNGKSKPVTRWPLGNGNRKRVTRATACFRRVVQKGSLGLGSFFWYEALQKMLDELLRSTHPIFDIVSSIDN
ncbi:hypothetical protein KQX54_005462 [Cotesia glomerata]|uniref:Uncharacterized protein n=1 Tax=Cotesia glomerata TaxID=32391 RepID=A0AAV7IF66_COTGL|nr:hypothetical protein KQX54_005462 [Cotesia glomerata]